MLSGATGGPSPWLHGIDGGMAGRVRDHDWSATPLGAIGEWPPCLGNTVGNVLATGAQAVLFWGPDFVAIYNDAYVATIGGKHPGAFGRPAAEGWTELWDDLAPLLEGVRATGETFRAKDRPFYLERHGRGETALFDVSYSAVRGEGGAVAGVLCIVQETTERVRSEAALAASERSLRTLMEGIPQLVWRSAEAGRWTWASPQWTAYTGLSDAASRGWSWLAAVHPEDRAGVEGAWRRADGTGRFEVDYRIRRAADGAWIWFQSRGSLVNGGSDEPSEWLGTSTDIEDQMQARAVLARAGEELEARVAERTAELMASEESLRQSQKMEAVGQLTGGIAHDFNNMLQGVAGGVDMARRRIGAGRAGDAERYLLAARAAVDRAAALTQRLLAFARQQRLEPKPVDADALVAGMADLIRRSIGPGIALELRLRDGAGAVRCGAIPTSWRTCC